jgi:hypothetical protein
MGRRTGTEKPKHICIQLLVKSAAVEARCIRAELWSGLGQWGRTRGEKGIMSRVRDHVILVFYGEAAVHRGDRVRHYPVAAKLGPPELDRHFDPLKAVGGKQQGKRVGDDRGLDARVMGERLRREFFAVDLLAEKGSRIAGTRRWRWPNRDWRRRALGPCNRPAKSQKNQCVHIDPGRGGRGTDHEVDEAFDVGRPLDEDRQIAGTARIKGGVAG